MARRAKGAQPPVARSSTFVVRQTVGDGGGEFYLREALQITSLLVVSVNEFVLNHVPRREGHQHRSEGMGRQSPGRSELGGHCRQGHLSL